MKTKILFVVAIAGLILGLSIFFTKPEILNEITKIAGNESETTTTLPFAETKPSMSNQTNATNQTTITEGVGVGGGTAGPTNETIEAKKVVTLEIIDLCDGKIVLESVGEGMERCLNQKYPYHLAMEVDGSNLRTWVYNYSELVRTYDLSNEITIYFLLVEDVSSVTHEIEQFYMRTSLECFYLGNYTLHTIWEIDPATRGMKITKMIAMLPLNVDSSKIRKTEGWEEVKLYLKTYEKDFYLGNLFFEIK